MKTNTVFNPRWILKEEFILKEVSKRCGACEAGSVGKIME
jgi:hypothetical protein